MNTIYFLQKHILELIQEVLELHDEQLQNIVVKIEFNGKFGDLSTNAAMVLASKLKIAPIALAHKIRDALTSPMVGEHENSLAKHVAEVNVVGAGFVNIKLTPETWHSAAHEFFAHPRKCFQLDANKPRKSFLIEFVSANPTGPLSIAHGRNAILGDVLSRVAQFVGHDVTREFYINDAGVQIDRLAASLKARCLELTGHKIDFPEDGYAGQYITTEAAGILKESFPKAGGCTGECSCAVGQAPISFFKEIGTKRMLKHIKKDLEDYRVFLDTWISEKQLHADGLVDKAIALLQEKGFLYTQEDGSVWFKATEFGDDKDRVVKKNDGTYTYVAADIAYHQQKFARKFDILIDVLGQDHHGYIRRLQAVMQALGYDAGKLHFIVYQLVSMKQGDQLLRMSKRAGVFESLSDVVGNVGADVARYFFLNRKADSHLEFDLELARRQDPNNPVFYVQYACVRCKSLLQKGAQDLYLGTYVQKVVAHDTEFISELRETEEEHLFNADEILLIKKICQLRDLLIDITESYQTHLLATYVYELANLFHAYYNAHKIVDPENVVASQGRILIVQIVRNALELGLELLGVSVPEKM